MITELRVEGMSCENCIRHVRQALESVSGVQRVQLDLLSARATIEHADETPAERLVLAIEDEGYTATSAS